MTRKKSVTLLDLWKQGEDIKKDIANKYVTKTEFLPVKTIVYGGVALILTGVATALVAKVVVAFTLWYFQSEIDQSGT